MYANQIDSDNKMKDNLLEPGSRAVRKKYELKRETILLLLENPTRFVL